jgi:hypothetical protein
MKLTLQLALLFFGEWANFTEQVGYLLFGFGLHYEEQFRGLVLGCQVIDTGFRVRGQGFRRKG